MRNRLILLASFTGSLFTWTPSASALTLKNVRKMDGDSCPRAFIPAVYGGYNKLMTGYNGYKDIGNWGLDLYIRPRRDSMLPMVWHNNLMWRLSFDYFPLQVPKGVYGVTEDIYSLNTGVVYQFHRLNATNAQKWVPFVGFGVGIYQDRVQLDTPASGKLTGSKNYLGFNGSAGLQLPIVHWRWPIRIIPEVRYHRVQVINGTATNLTYQIAISLWPKR